MKNMILAAALVGASALTAVAQTTPALLHRYRNAPGRNDRCEITRLPRSQAQTASPRLRLRNASRRPALSEVKNLKKDDNGIWMAAGTKDGKAVIVALDYQGNVVAK